MSRHLASVVVVLAVAGTALAVPSFSFNSPAMVGGTIYVPEGGSVMVGLYESGSAAISGATIYLGTAPFAFADPGDPFTADGPLTIDSLVIDAPGSGTIFDGNTTGATIQGSWTGFPPVLVFADLTTQNGFVATTGMGLVATITLSAKPGTAGTLDCSLSTSTFAADSVLLTTGGAALDFAQATVPVVITPEPATVLMLVLGGLPLIRRRRA